MQSTEQRCVLKDRNSWAFCKLCWVVWSPGQFCLQYVNYLHIQFYKLFQRGISIMLLSKFPSYPLQDEANLQIFRAFFSPFFYFSFSPFFLSTDCPDFVKASKKSLTELIIFLSKTFTSKKVGVVSELKSFWREHENSKTWYCHIPTTSWYIYMFLCSIQNITFDCCYLARTDSALRAVQEANENSDLLPGACSLFLKN